jgi:hypothetical protein
LLNMGESIELSSISWYYWLGIVFASWYVFATFLTFNFCDKFVFQSDLPSPLSELTVTGAGTSTSTGLSTLALVESTHSQVLSVYIKGVYIGTHYKFVRCGFLCQVFFFFLKNILYMKWTEMSCVTHCALYDFGVVSFCFFHSVSLSHFIFMTSVGIPSLWKGIL